MKKIKNAVTSHHLLKWLSAVLLLIASTFSGYASELKTYNSEPVKTELRDARRVSSRKVFYFKRAFDNKKYSCVLPGARSENFISILFHQENKQEAKLKSSLIELPATNKQAVCFLIHFSSKNSEEFELNHS